jgi:hypothetical protein
MPIINTAILAIVSYVAGLLTGIFAGRIFFKNADGKKTNADLVLVVVTIVWAASFIVDIINPNYETPVYIHGLMGAIVGFFYKGVKKDDQ